MVLTHKTVSLADQVFDRLENDILSGVYKRGFLGLAVLEKRVALLELAARTVGRVCGGLCGAGEHADRVCSPAELQQRPSAALEHAEVLRCIRVCL